MRRILQSLIRSFAITAFFVAAASSASAGGAFVTDDPGTAGRGKYEINLLSQYTHIRGETGGAVSGVDVNYGLSDQLDAHVYAPLEFDKEFGKPASIGLGDVELGFKYRIVDGEELSGWHVAIAPTINAPSGAASHNLGSGSVHVFLPVWIARDWGNWSIFGGGGYMINPGPSNRDWGFTGVGVTYQIDQRWSVGGEIFYVSAAQDDGKGGFGFNIGGAYTLSDTYHILFSAGRNITNAADDNLFSTIVGLQITF